jgi:hypothetical protein
MLNLRLAEGLNQNFFHMTENYSFWMLEATLWAPGLAYDCSLR